MSADNNGVEDGSGGMGPRPTPTPTEKPKKGDKSLWLTAWRDHLAGLRAYSSCIDMCDINGDGDFKLIVADASRKLKVFSGTSLVNEAALLDAPTAVASFYSDYNEEVRKPLIAVAGGPFIFIYKNMRPFYKFTMAPDDLSAAEMDVWAGLKSGKVTTDAAVETLDGLKESGTRLSNRSIDLLCYDNEASRHTFVEGVKNTPLQQYTVVTCMNVIMKDRDERGGVGCLVVGTESSKVLVLDKSGANVLKKVSMPSVPVHLLVSGLVDVEYRVIVACRNGNIHIIKNGELLGIVLEVESQPVAMARMENQIVVGTMSNHLNYFNLKGTKIATLFMPSIVTNMCSLVQENVRNSKAIVVALANSEIRVYVGKTLLNKMLVYDVVTAMKVGRYGREESTLVLVLKSGSVVISMLPRSASLQPNAAQAQGPPAEQDVPLRVPKRTNLYVEMTKREKDFGVDMHRVFQRDLCKLRLQTARAYTKILTDGQGTQSHFSQTSIRLTAHVQGLGPLFKIKVNVQNTGTKALTNIPIVFTYNQDIYTMQRPHLLVPSLVPSLVYNFEVPVECLDERADVIRVFVCNPQSAIPIITALVNMPIADFLMNDQNA
jgi:Bardet-Biedl syndrome 1 protein